MHDQYKFVSRPPGRGGPTWEEDLGRAALDACMSCEGVRRWGVWLGEGSGGITAMGPRFTGVGKFSAGMEVGALSISSCWAASSILLPSILAVCNTCQLSGALVIAGDSLLEFGRE